jgi:hypothetical protein
MRNWRPYSSIARDGEKTVYCQRGNHSVYYGNAFISFKPSKLIWCEDCKDTYYEVKPTLFDELITKEVTKMDTTKVNPTTNPKEGPTMKVEETTFRMTDKQIAFIRDLFKSKKQFMTIDEQESLINKMKGHLDGSAVLTTKWASAAIAKLKSYNKERSAS